MQVCLTAEDERIEVLLTTTYKKVMQAMDESKRPCCVIPNGLGSSIGKVHATRDVCPWGNFRWPYHDRLAARNDRTACELTQGHV